MRLVYDCESSKFSVGVAVVGSFCMNGRVVRGRGRESGRSQALGTNQSQAQSKVGKNVYRGTPQRIRKSLN